MADRRHDLTLYGATGFTGRQAARYLAAHSPAGLRWALAGRDRRRLEALAAEVHAPSIEVADSADPASVDAMVSRTRVLATTAGPFALYGGPVVDACVRHGTAYADITGETIWVRELIERHHAKAAAEGTRIVPFCGFDSVPSDLGTLLVATWIREHWGQPTRRVSASFSMRGGFNGGTLATMLETLERGEKAAANDVLLLNPASHAAEAERARSADFTGERFDPVRRTWLVPFVMAPINTRVVRRSNALFEASGEGYGSDFAYEEAMEVRGRWAARVTRAGLGAFGRALAWPPARSALRRIGPKPGEGPSEETMEHGFMRARLVGEAGDGRRVRATLLAQGDPGNRVTVRTLCEAGLALATQGDSLPGAPGRGGILTPATGLGLLLLERLKVAGMAVEIEPL